MLLIRCNSRVKSRVNKKDLQRVTNIFHKYILLGRNEFSIHKR